MDIRINETSLPGCFLISLLEQKDKRGNFVKLFHAGAFKENGLETNFPEEYYSFSHRGVLRGLHFQVPPHEHVKLIYCLEGVIFDAVLDIRRNLPSFGKFTTFTLEGEEAKLLYIPPGIAHGFQVQSESALVLYKVSKVYSSDHDTGILWNSAGIPWPVKTPVVSTRDEAFPALSFFESPFIYNAERSA